MVPEVVGSNPIFHPSKKAAPKGGLVCLKSVQNLFCKAVKKTRPFLPQAKQPFLKEFLPKGSLEEPATTAIPYFSASLLHLLYLKYASRETTPSSITAIYTNNGTGIGSPDAYECIPER